MKKINEMKITFKALSVNEGFARACIAAFCVQANPTLDVLTDIKTAVSEAVTNAVVHAYPKNSEENSVTIFVELFNEGVSIEISDTGIGIEDVEKAREPFFTSKPQEERSGMGFTVMESFMDDVKVTSKNGTKVKMFKYFDGEKQNAVGE